jgi:DnaJ-class molecular chaperone
MGEKKYSYEEILKARETLELPMFVKRDYVKKRHAELVKQYHPDKNSGSKESEIKIKQINEAYAIINDYFDNYSYCFLRECVCKYNPEACSSFSNYEDPMWGNK